MGRVAIAASFSKKKNSFFFFEILNSENSEEFWKKFFTISFARQTASAGNSLKYEKTKIMSKKLIRKSTKALHRNKTRKKWKKIHIVAVTKIKIYLTIQQGKTTAFLTLFFYWFSIADFSS